MTQNRRVAAAAALETYRVTREHRSNDAEDIVDLLTDLAHLADRSDDPDLTGVDALLSTDVEIDTAGEAVASAAFDNYRAERRV